MVRRLFTPVLLTLLLAACGETAADLGPPEGWEAEGDRWWQTDVDADLAFRDLSGFETMGLGGRPDGLRDEGPVVRNVQRRFLKLYRNHPEVVDSIFGAAVVPLVDAEARPGDADEVRDELVRQVNRRIHEAFYPPQPLRSEREDNPIVVPDSLQGRISGTLELQVYLDADGRPLAIEKLQGIHPTFDALAMRNYAERTWQPGYLVARGLGDDGRKPVPSWVRTDLTIGG